ncbi:MAG: hypothetical protein KAT41_06845 [Candidatus Marinimicrobia bacterium]|nr:hypothetical protein [Candidatus Neomarinimicrobiota bacterium]
MGKAELLILLGAIVIWGIYTLSINEARFNNEVSIMQSQFEISAVGIANSYLEEAKSKAFDEILLSSTSSTFSDSLPGEFTALDGLGIDADEIYPNFDDIDDFHNYTVSDTTSEGFVYTVSITVGYVATSDFDNFSANRTFYKRMNVIIDSPDLSNNLNLSRIYPYIG